MKHVVLIAGSASFLLMACSGTGSVTPTTKLGNNALTPALALANGETVTAEPALVSAFATDYANQTTYATESTVSMSKNDAGELSLTVNGETYNFTSSHRIIEENGEFYVYATNGEIDTTTNGDQQWKNIVSLSGDLSTFLDGSNPNTVVLMRYRDIESPADDFTNSFGETGYFIAGSTTKTSAVGDFTAKNYTAMLEAAIYPTVGFVSTQNRTVLRSQELNVVANFENNSIEGMASNLLVRNYERGVSTPDATAIDGTLVFSGGAIVGGNFVGTVSADEQLQRQIGITELGAYFKGAFFGTEAQTIGGVIRGSATSANGDVSLTGGFASN